MADLREKLVELIRDGRYKAESICNKNTDCQRCEISDTDGNCKYGCMADHLIANGVTFGKDINVPDKNVGKWIPVTERLPEEFVSVLVYAPGIAPLPTVFEAYFARGCWVTRAMVMQGHEVTHWMEMPAGPGEVDNG